MYWFLRHPIEAPTLLAIQWVVITWRIVTSNSGPRFK